MINTTSEFQRMLSEDNRNFLERVTITLEDDTVLTLTNENLWQGGLTITDSVSADNKFEIGTAVINKATIILNNIYDTYSDYDFNYATVAVEIGLTLESTELPEYIDKGTFTVIDANYNGAIITLTCYDSMYRFDQLYTLTDITYPASLYTIVYDACNKCDVTLDTPEFPHYDLIVPNAPSDEATTFREVIAYCAQVAGCFARCNKDGNLELKWYDTDALVSATSNTNNYDGGSFDDSTPYSTGDDIDGGTFNPWETGDVADGGLFSQSDDVWQITSLYEKSISVDDVVITGVRILVDAVEEDPDSGYEQEVVHTYMEGTEGYVVEISRNPFITDDNADDISAWLGSQLVGLTFRKASITHGANPAMEAGDVAIVVDRKENVYPILVSSTTFSVGSGQKTVSAAENPIRKSAARFSETVKNYVESKKLVYNEINERQQAYNELNEAISNASGLYVTIEETQSGGYIYYMHDKPLLAESSNVWKMTEDAWAGTTNYDGDDTVWNSGMTIDGDMIANILSVHGINADWINSGAIQIKDANDNETFYASAESGAVRINANTVYMTSGRNAQDIITTMSGYQDGLSQWVSFNTNGLELGDFSEQLSLFRAKLTNTELGFYYNGVKKAYVNTTGFHFVRGEVETDLRIGNFLLKNGEGGRFEVFYSEQASQSEE